MKILLIEPALTFAQFLRLCLTRLGYQVAHAAAAENLRETVLRHAPDLIISEVVIPGANGLEVCRLIGNDPLLAKIPVVIISTDGCMQTRQAASQAGCVDYLTKPVTSRDVHELMQRHLPFHHKRHGIRVRMELTATVHDGGESRQQKITSLGEGGIYIETARQHPVGTRLDLEIPLPGLSSPLRLKGEVVHVLKTAAADSPPGMGVKFVGLDHNTTILLKHYMESYLSDFLPVPPAA